MEDGSEPFCFVTEKSINEEIFSIWILGLRPKSYVMPMLYSIILSVGLRENNNMNPLVLYLGGGKAHSQRKI